MTTWLVAFRERTFLTKTEERSFTRERDVCVFFGELKDREDVSSVSYYIK